MASDWFLIDRFFFGGKRSHWSIWIVSMNLIFFNLNFGGKFEFPVHHFRWPHFRLRMWWRHDPLKCDLSCPHILLLLHPNLSVFLVELALLNLYNLPYRVVNPCRPARTDNSVWEIAIYSVLWIVFLFTIIGSFCHFSCCHYWVFLSFFFLPLLGLFVIFLFTIILKEQKQKKESQICNEQKTRIFIFKNHCQTELI